MYKLNFKHRSNEKEIMDDGVISLSQWLLFIKDLAWVNHYLINIRSFTQTIKTLCQRKLPQSQAITLAEFACGGGNILQTLAHWAHLKMLPLQFVGFDINPRFIDYAKNNMTKGLPIQYEEQDIFSPEFIHQQFDIIICNLFCHHLTNKQLIEFFRQVYQQANLGVIINDLHRHRLAHMGFYLISWLKQFSLMVKHDGLVSIRRGFIKREIIELLQQAGITDYQVKWRFPFYFNIVITKPSF